jgi:type I restriction enzyme S subunit
MDVMRSFKHTEAGMLPDDWSCQDFADLYGEPSRNGIYKTAEFHGRGTRIVNMGEMFGLEFIADQNMNRVVLTTRELSVSGLQDGDLLFGRRSIVPEGAGKCSLVVRPNEPLTFESSIIRVRVKKSAVCPKFYYYYFAAPAGRSLISTIVSGTTVQGIRGTELKRLRVPRPTKTEQEAIAEALSDVDALIESLEQLLAKRRHLKQGAMRELLTGKKRLPGFTEEWGMKTLGDLFGFSGGFTASRDQLSLNGYCYLHYGDIHTSSKSFVDVRCEYQDIPKLNIPLTNISPSSLLSDGDVVFVDASEDDEGTSKHVVILNPEKVPFISGLHTIVAKAKSDALEHSYRRYCFHTEAVKAQFRFFAVGTKVSGISKSNITKINLPVPSVPEQAAIATILSDMDSDLAALEEKLAKARNLKKGMMQELLTGRIRLV